jgi:Arc/MetJ family transcription regulator
MKEAVRLLAAELPRRKAIKTECLALETARTNVYTSFASYTSRPDMRTNIDIDDELMEEAMKATGQRTKKAAVVEALRQAIQTARRRQALKELHGIGWEGDLDAMREGRFVDEKPW